MVCADGAVIGSATNCNVISLCVGLVTLLFETSVCVYSAAHDDGSECSC